jgi:hypothetical protein
VPIQRLNRTEYATAVKDLLGVEIDAGEFLPNEIEVDGFDNIAAALSVSPAFLEQYIGVARHVAHQAIGETVPKLASVYVPPPGDDQDNYVDGMPLGTRGGVRFEHNFLADGEYRINITDLDVGLTTLARKEHTRCYSTTEVFRATLGGEDDLALEIAAAPGRAELMQRFADIPVRVPRRAWGIVTTSSVARFHRADFASRPTASVSRARYAHRVISGISGPFRPTGHRTTSGRRSSSAHEMPIKAPRAQLIAATLAERAFAGP